MIVDICEVLYFAFTGCLQIQSNNFPADFQDTF